MKVLTKTIELKTFERQSLTVVDVVHDLPTWMFPMFTKCGSYEVCPVCYKKMGTQNECGGYVETCSYIRLDNGDTHPIHRKCFDELKESTVKRLK